MRAKSISYVKAHLAEVIEELRSAQGPLVITQNGASRAVLQDHESYERMRAALAMLKLVALGERDVAEERTRSQLVVFRDLRRKLRDPKPEDV